jgi:hypothetical protein
MEFRQLQTGLAARDFALGRRICVPPAGELE